MRKINLSSIGNFAGQVCELVACGLMIVASRKVVDYAVGEYCSTIVGYSDAVNAIMNSTMWSSDKREAVSLLKRHEDMEYYRAVINVMKDSRLFSSDKLEIIKSLSER